MPGKPQPLVNNQPIVKDGGLPTDYFIRWAQQRQIDIAAGITAEEAQQLIVDFLAEHPLTAGTGISITPSGSIADDLTIALNAVLGNLNDVDMSVAPTNGQVLIYDDVDMTWKPGDQSGGGGGGAGALTRIAQVVLLADAPSIDFTGIPGTFDDLVAVVNVQSPLTGASNYLHMQFNADTGNNYGYYWTTRYGTSGPTLATTVIDLGDIPPQATGGSAQGLSTRTVQIYSYKDPALQKQIAAQGAVRFVTSGGYGPDASDIETAGQWYNTAPVTSIKFFGSAANLKAGSVITLYGRGGNVSGSGATTARYWRLRAMRGGNASNPTDGLGYTLVNYRDAGGAALIATPGLNGFANATDTGGGWAVAEAYNGASGAGNGWYSGSGNAGGVYHNPYLGYDFGVDVTPATVEFAPLFGFAWTIGQIVAVDYSADKVIWRTLCLLEPRPGADNTVESYTLPT